MFGGSRINISNPKEIYVAIFNKKFSLCRNWTTPRNLMFHITIQLQPSQLVSIFKTNFKFVQICICNKICRWRCRLAEKSDSTPLKTFVIFETNCVLAYICIYLHIYLRQNLNAYHHLPVCRLRCWLEERSESPPLKTFLSPDALLPLSHSQCTEKFLNLFYFQSRLNLSVRNSYLSKIFR